MKNALTAALVFVALSTSAMAQDLERGNGADPVTLDPQRATTAAEANILRDLYEGLVTYDANGNLVPGAAIDWDISKDGLTYTFSLRVASWSNAVPVTARDFQLAFQRLFDPALAAPDAAMFAGILGAEEARSGVNQEAMGVRIVDARTLEIELSQPDPLFLHLLARPAALPVYRNYHTVAPIPSANQPVNGAYRFDGYEPGVGVWLIRNESYHEAEAVQFQNVIYRPYDRQRALASFADGELLISNDIPVFALSEIAEEFGAALHEAMYSGSFFLATNMAGVLSNSDLRRAIALAIDRIRLADEVWLGTMIPTLSLLPAGLADQTTPAVADLGPNEPSVRRAEARALLQDAGYNSDNPLTLTLAVGGTELQQLTGTSIAEDLAEIGIVVNLISRSAPDHQAHILGDRDYDLATVAWIGAVGHVDEYLALFEVGDLDITGYGNPAISSLLAEARTTADRTVRSALYAATDRAVSARIPAIALMHYASFNLVSPELEGWEDNVIDVHLSRWLRPPTPAEVE